MSKELEVTIEYKALFIDENGKEYGKAEHTISKGHSNAIDLRVAEDVVMNPGEYALIKSNVAMKLPEGYKADIRMRSSSFKKYGVILTNAPGLVDTAYCGTDDVWCFSLFAPIKHEDIIDSFIEYDKATSTMRRGINRGKEISRRLNHKMFSRKIVIPKGTAVAQWDLMPVMPEVTFIEGDLSKVGRGSTNNKLEAKEKTTKKKTAAKQNLDMV